MKLLYAAAWILGMAFMGTQLPVLHAVLYPVLILSMIILFLQFTLFRKTTSLSFQCIKGCIYSILFFSIAYHYAQSALQERLVYKETEIAEVEIIAYVRKINQLKVDAIQQEIQVLNRHAHPVNWLSVQKIKTDAQPSLELGKYYRLTGQIRPAHAYAVTGAFDVEKWYIQMNLMSGFRPKTIQALTTSEVYALGYAQHLGQQQKLLHRLQLSIEQQRLYIRDFIYRQPLTHKGLVLALLTGDESFLDQQTTTFFQRFGISHLLAISGPHVLIFAVMVCGVLQYGLNRYCPQIFLHLPRSYLLLLPFCSCVLLYCAFVGFEIPAIRTLLSCCGLSLLIWLRQRISALTLLLLSASILLLFDPFSVLSAAFWLSYGACFVLLRIYQTTLRTHREPLHTWRQKIIATMQLLVESQWKIFVALLPLMVIFFKQISWISPISNLIAIPLISIVVVPLEVLAAVAFYIFEPLSSLFFQLADTALVCLLWILQGFDAVLPIQLKPIALNIWQLAILILFMIILFMPKSSLPKAWAVLTIVPLLGWASKDQPFELTLLDVGQGQAIYLQQGQQRAMIDMGGSYDETKFSVGKQIIQPFLSRQGVKQLDQLFLTHLDQDHSGSYTVLKNELLIKQVYSNQALSLGPQSTFSYCTQGQIWRWSEDIEIKILSPHSSLLPKVPYQQNELSCVLYVSIKHAEPYQSFLIMGDAGWRTEFQLLHDYPDLKVDVLIMGHHGSRHSSAYAFLKHYRPKLALASAGFNNRYGHPSEVTQARLKALNIPLLTTAAQGSISFKLQSTKRIELTVARQSLDWLQSTELIEPAVTAVNSPRPD